jgi:benzoate-CoA ligase
MASDDPSLNLSGYFLERNLEQRAERPCVFYRDKVYTYRQVNAWACRVANALVSLGVRQEDRVLIILPDRPEFVATLFAVHKCGAVLTMANPQQPADALLYYFNYTRAPVAVIHHEVLPLIEPLRAQIRYTKHVLVVGGEPGPFLDFDQIVRQQAETFENAPVHPDDPAVWLFSSGSTGRPKACMHLAHDFVCNTEHYARQVLQMSENDRTLSVPKLFFGYATGTNLWFPFAFGGATVLFEERPTPEVLFENIARYRPTFLTTVPTTINKMLQYVEEGSGFPPRRAGRVQGSVASPLVGGAGARAPIPDLSSLRVCVSAGEALPAELYRRWIKRFNVEILDGIGSAEMFHIYISNRIGNVKEGSLGKLVPGYTAKVVDPGACEVPTGELGTLWIKGDSRMTGYFQDNEKSRRTVLGEWVNTGDQFRVDAEGYFWYEGRADDMLKVGGLWVSPMEIENVLLQHAAVKECCVVPYRDAAELVLPRAFVVLKEGFAGDERLSAELIAFAKERLAHYKAPRQIRYLDALPRNDRGKAERKKLQES